MKDTSASGHVQVGEEYIDTAKRKLKEDLLLLKGEVPELRLLILDNIELKEINREFTDYLINEISSKAYMATFMGIIDSLPTELNDIVELISADNLRRELEENSQTYTPGALHSLTIILKDLDAIK